MRRFSKNEYNDSFIATIGVDFEIREVKIDDKIVKMQLWDTAGQERFRAITASYYKGCHLALIVFDVTSEETFQSIPNWIKDVRTYNADAPIMLVANKVDLVSKRQVTAQAIQTAAHELGLPFVETSAKDNQNVESAFLTRAREYVQNELRLPPKHQREKAGAKDSARLTDADLSGKSVKNTSGGCCK